MPRALQITSLISWPGSWIGCRKRCRERYVNWRVSGDRAGLRLLSIVLQDSEEAIGAMLREAVLPGLVSDLDGAFAFTHNRIQEAAYALIPEESRAQHHLNIGRSIIAKLTQDEMEEKIFDIVNQLNAGRRLISNLDEKDLVAGLNLRAGKKAKASTAYDSACIYLSAGMDLVGGDAWERRHELAFSLWLERAESEYLNGSFDEAGSLIAELLQRANSKLEKVAAYRLRIFFILMQAEFQQAVDRGLECLSLFASKCQFIRLVSMFKLSTKRYGKTLGIDQSKVSLICH